MTSSLGRPQRVVTPQACDCSSASPIPAVSEPGRGFWAPGLAHLWGARASLPPGRSADPRQRAGPVPASARASSRSVQYVTLDHDPNTHTSTRVETKAGASGQRERQPARLAEGSGQLVSPLRALGPAPPPAAPAPPPQGEAGPGDAPPQGRPWTPCLTVGKPGPRWPPESGEEGGSPLWAVHALDPHPRYDAARTAPCLRGRPPNPPVCSNPDRPLSAKHPARRCLSAGPSEARTLSQGRGGHGDAVAGHRGGGPLGEFRDREAAPGKAGALSG